VRPSHDPDSDKYPDRTFYEGKWRTEKQIQSHRAWYREWERKRWASDPLVRLKKTQYKTLRNARQNLERSIERAELHH